MVKKKKAKKPEVVTTPANTSPDVVIGGGYMGPKMVFESPKRDKPGECRIKGPIVAGVPHFLIQARGQVSDRLEGLVNRLETNVNKLIKEGGTNAVDS